MDNDPWIFQKTARRGLYITQQCINLIGDESKELMQQEMSSEINRLRKFNEDKGEIVRRAFGVEENNE